MSDFDLQITQMDRKRHRAAVMELVNGERRKRNLPSLRYAPSLRISAQAWAVSMSRRSRFEHGSGSRSFQQRALRFPYVVNAAIGRARVAENLGLGTGPFTTPREVVSGWMSSPAHKRILLGNYTHHAVWTEQDDPQRTGVQLDAVTVVHHFGRR